MNEIVFRTLPLSFRGNCVAYFWGSLERVVAAAGPAGSKGDYIRGLFSVSTEGQGKAAGFSEAIETQSWLNSFALCWLCS